MIIDPKKTTVAYRCPSCGAGVMSVVGLFNLNADMVKLKCDCQGSAMTLIYSNEQESPKVRISVPCVLCPNPHIYTVSSSIFFKDDLFLLPCPYSDINIAVTGETNKVKAELARSELELLDLLEQSGVDSFDALHKNDNTSFNPEALGIISFMLRELDEEDKIECDCPEGTGKDYELEFYGSSAEISCKCCGCKKIFPTDSLIAANELLHADKLSLKSKS
jgi:hypothetical protein